MDQNKLILIRTINKQSRVIAITSIDMYDRLGCNTIRMTDLHLHNDNNLTNIKTENEIIY